MQEFNFVVTTPEAELIVQSLAQLPFAQVGNLIPKLQEQARAQYRPPVVEPAGESQGVAEE